MLRLLRSPTCREPAAVYQHAAEALRDELEVATVAVTADLRALRQLSPRLRAQVVEALPPAVRWRHEREAADAAARGVRPRVEVQIAWGWLLEGMIAQVEPLPPAELRNARVHVRFAGEVGADAGGLSRELFSRWGEALVGAAASPAVSSTSS